MFAHERGTILLITPQEAHVKSQLPKSVREGVISVKSLSQAKSVLESKPIKVILSDEVDIFEELKTLYEAPVRILFVKDLNLNVTESAINRGEVFRFILNSSSEKEIGEAILQAVHHYDIVHQHKHLIQNKRAKIKN